MAWYRRRAFAGAAVPFAYIDPLPRYLPLAFTRESRTGFFRRALEYRANIAPQVLPVALSYFPVAGGRDSFTARRGVSRPRGTIVLVDRRQVSPLRRRYVTDSRFRITANVAIMARGSGFFYCARTRERASL